MHANSYNPNSVVDVAGMIRDGDVAGVAPGVGDGAAILGVSRQRIHQLLDQ